MYVRSFDSKTFKTKQTNKQTRSKTAIRLKKVLSFQQDMRELSQLRLDGERAASGFVRERRAAESCQYRRGAETRRPWGAGPEYQRVERTDKRAEKKKVDSRSQRVSSSRWLVGFSPAAPARPAGPSVGCEALKPMRHAAEVQHEPSQVLFVRHQPPDCTATCAWTAGGVFEEAAADTSCSLCKKNKNKNTTTRIA